MTILNEEANDDEETVRADERELEAKKKRKQPRELTEETDRADVGFFHRRLIRRLFRAVPA